MPNSLIQFKTRISNRQCTTAQRERDNHTGIDLDNTWTTWKELESNVVGGIFFSFSNSVNEIKFYWDLF